MLCSVLLLASSHALFSRQEFRNNLVSPGLTCQRASGAGCLRLRRLLSPIDFSCGFPEQRRPALAVPTRDLGVKDRTISPGNEKTKANHRRHEGGWFFEEIPWDCISAANIPGVPLAPSHTLRLARNDRGIADRRQCRHRTTSPGAKRQKR
jgi:hypothetical protein